MFPRLVKLPDSGRPSGSGRYPGLVLGRFVAQGVNGGRSRLALHYADGLHYDGKAPLDERRGGGVHEVYQIEGKCQD